MRSFLIAALLPVIASFALVTEPATSPVEAAQSLQIVQASPSIYCLFSVDCAVTRTDTQATFTLEGAGGYGVLHTSTFKASPGSPAEGWWGYEYRIDLSHAEGSLAPNCIDAMRIPLGGVSVLFDYDGNGTTGEQVYLVEPGDTSPTLALRDGPDVTFYFDPPVCTGDSSFTVGVAAGGPPRGVLADLQPEQGSLIQVGARAPHIGVTVEFKFSQLYYLIATLPPGGIIGPTPKAREGRRQAMLNEINAALALVENGHTLPAVRVLERLRSLADGVQPDWIQDDPGTRGNERTQVYDAIQDTIDTILEGSCNSVRGGEAGRADVPARAAIH
jgi:hypothetical protein